MAMRQISKILRCMPASAQWIGKTYVNRMNRWSKAAFLALNTNVSLVTKFRLTLAIPVVYALGVSNEKNGANAEVKNKILDSDKLFALSKFKDSYEALSPYKDIDDTEVLWRLSRGLYNMAEESNMTGDAKLKVILEAESYVLRARALDGQNFAVEKWIAIILDAKTTLEGIKSKISSLPTFKTHILRAIELNPKDGTSLHMMGTYYYNIADLPWYQKQIASTLFGKVPDASFEEALTYFSKAEDAQPNFYSKNLLMLGKTYKKLGMDDLARHWLKRAADSDGKTEEDKKVKNEATDMLKKM